MKPRARFAARITAVLACLLLVGAAAWWAQRASSSDPEPLAPDATPPVSRAADGKSSGAEIERPREPLDAPPAEPRAGSLPRVPRSGSGVDAERPGLADPRLVLAGRVLDGNVTPIPSAEILQVPVALLFALSVPAADPRQSPIDWEALPRARSGPDGTFEFRGLVPHVPSSASAAVANHDSLMFVRAPGLAATVLPCLPDRAAPPRFDAGAIILRPGAALTARFVDESGVPVAGVMLARSTSGARRPDPVTGRWELLSQALAASSDADGHVHIDGESPGTLDLETGHPEFVPVTLTAGLVAGATSDLGEITLRRGDAIAGLVTDKDGSPIVDAAILARVAELTGCAPDEDPILSNLLIRSAVRGAHDVRTRSGARGEFSVGTLNHERYAVFADAPGYEPVCADDVRAGSDDVVLVMQREALAVLTVVDAESREPLTDVRVTAQRCHAPVDGEAMSYGPYLVVLAGAEAARAAGVPGDGTGLMVVLRPGSEGTQISVSAAGHESATFILQGAIPGQRIDETLSVAAALALEGRVLESSGAPILHARVLLVPPDDVSPAQRTPRTAITDANGGFRISDLFEGAWTVSVSAGGWADSVPEVFELQAGRTPQPAVFVMERGGYLAGSVRTASGSAPPAGLRVRIVAPDGRAVRVPVGSSFGSDTASSIALDADGRWSCSRVLAPGSYTLSLLRASSGKDDFSGEVLVTTSIQLGGGDSLSVPFVISD